MNTFSNTLQCHLSNYCSYAKCLFYGNCPILAFCSEAKTTFPTFSFLFLSLLIFSPFTPPMNYLSVYFSFANFFPSFFCDLKRYIFHCLLFFKHCFSIFHFPSWEWLGVIEGFLSASWSRARKAMNHDKYHLTEWLFDTVIPAKGNALLRPRRAQKILILRTIFSPIRYTGADKR